MYKKPALYYFGLVDINYVYNIKTNFNFQFGYRSFISGNKFFSVLSIMKVYKSAITLITTILAVLSFIASFVERYAITIPTSKLMPWIALEIRRTLIKTLA